jgi:teichuronic acid biosynthesis glycosyltransferase TuaG
VNPRVTAVMAARNAEATIGAAIDAVLTQTMTDLELIVVDDGSTDATSVVVAGYADPRVRLVRLGANAGRGGARNEALRHARGRYLAICDADDVSLPDRIQRQADYLDEHPSVGVVGGQVLNFGDWGGPTQVYRYPLTTDGVERRFARGQMPVPHQASMLRRDLVQAVGGYAPECRRAQDLELFLRLRPRTAMVNLDEAVLLYRHDRRTSLRYWVVNGTWRRYAVARSGAVLSGRPPVSVAAFRRRPTAPAAVAWDCASYVRSRLHERLVGPRTL